MESGAWRIQGHAKRRGQHNVCRAALVLGRLREAGPLLHDVDAGMFRALLAMFIVSEVHSFNDGNGRLAHLVINSELVLRVRRGSSCQRSFARSISIA
jgi:hypothetical protein